LGNVKPVHPVSRVRTLWIWALVFVLGVAWPRAAGAFSVLAHEAIIDTAWNNTLRPLILLRFPKATPEELSDAHGYAYGGAIIQDIGYYPHGSRLFSDLTHYVRGGDFILALLHDAKDVNGYAFALGALSHYAADLDGHSMGTNRAVPILYPNVQKTYGDIVTYEQSPSAHLKTEFGFDVMEIAQQHYAPDSYHSFIGFGVAIPLLEQAFQETYGLDLKVVLTDEAKVFGSYRHAVATLIPKATRIAWTLKKDDILKSAPGATRKTFMYNLSRASYEKDWGHDYLKPTFGEKCAAFFMHLVPKIGPLKVLKLSPPTPETELMFEASFNAALDRYKTLLGQVRTGDPSVPNSNFDTGNATPPGIYFMNDDAHAHLLEALARQDFAGVTPELRAELLQFYADPEAPYATKRKDKDWEKVLAAVQQLKQFAPATLSAEASPASR
jgi:Zinc dependent phospholipase C